MYTNIGVYQIVCKATEKRYIGSTVVSFKSRWATHKRLLASGKHHSTRLQNAWNKYGENNFLFLILDILPAQECLKYEQVYLDCIGKDNLLNIKLTANAYPDNNSKERREKLSKINTGRKLSKETIDKISRSKIGKIPSEETREKMRRASIGRKHTKESIAKMIDSRARRGPVSEETKRRMSESRILRPPVSEITKEKMKKSLIARWSSVPDFLIAANIITGEVIKSNSYEHLSAQLSCSKTALWSRINKEELCGRLINKVWSISLIDELKNN